MRVWVTKYALTTGIYEAEVEQSESAPSMVAQRTRDTAVYFHGEGKDWHRTEEGAKSRANKMVRAKIKGLQKQLAKLEKTVF